mmetsp:Transcript_49644/g.142378  ORF Transcript_49644/g.142378 Transcript_49644/m.142378 type:complete len:261 (+) Transcript_49644:1379-2161(+)
MRSCVPWFRKPVLAVHRSSLSGDLRKVPSPPQGTSQSTRSNRSNSSSPGRSCRPTRKRKVDASPQVTTNGAQNKPWLRRNVRSCRCLSRSLDTNSVVFNASEVWALPLASSLALPSWDEELLGDDNIMSNICKVLPPGAAQRSKTAWPNFGRNAKAGNMAAASCRASSPQLWACKSRLVTRSPSSPLPPSAVLASDTSSRHAESAHGTRRSRAPKCARSSPSARPLAGAEALRRKQSANGRSNTASAEVHSSSGHRCCDL